MDRRDFLTAHRKATPETQADQNHINRVSAGGLNPYTGTFGTTEVVHLLKRTMFGAAKSDVDYFKSKTVIQAVDELLNPATPLPSPPVKDYDTTGAAVPDTIIAAGATWVSDPNTDGTINSRRRAAFKKWWFGVMINQDRSIREKMTMFWHNHFSTESTDIDNAQYVYKHHNLLRSSSLGNFKVLVKEVTIDPGMLRYLNGYLNTNTAPDENYGRELQELFTLGKENNPNYTEDDVKAAARVLTGWRIQASTISSFYDNSKHDKNNKQFSTFFSSHIVTGKNSATAGDEEVTDLINMIFDKKQEVSLFIVKKIYRWFCYYTIDADTETNIILPLAQIFRDSNWEIKPVLSALLKSEHFFDLMSRGCLIKSPVENIVGLCREFNIVFPNPSTDYLAAYGMWNFLVQQATNMNQNIGDPPSVAGWPSYYQEPQFYELWINSDTLPKRNAFADRMIQSGYTFSGKTIKIDPVAFTKLLSNPGDPNILINDALELLYRVPLSDVSKQVIKKQILLSNQDQDYYWTNAWNAYLAAPTDNTVYQTVFQRLRDLYKYLMGLAEYQLA